MARRLYRFRRLGLEARMLPHWLLPQQCSLRLWALLLGSSSLMPTLTHPSLRAERCQICWRTRSIALVHISTC